MRRILNWLINASPQGILLVYAVVIVVFAGLFAAWPEDFYQSYIKYEPVSRARKAMLANEIKAALESEFKRAPDLGKGITYQFATTLDFTGEHDATLFGYAIIFAALQGAEDPLFSLKVPFVISPQTHKVVVEKPGLVSLPDDPSPPKGWDGKIRPVYLMADPGSPVEDQSLLPHRPQERETVGKAVSKALDRVALAATTVSHTLEVVCAEEGRRCSKWEAFGGMLYYSAITITTVGYGDIVPLSNLARFLAAAEATFGIVLLGLFVNSLYRFASTPGHKGGGKS